MLTEWYQDHKWTSKGLSRKSTTNVCKYKWRIHWGVYEAHSLEETHVLYLIFSCRYQTKALCIDSQNSLIPPLHNLHFNYPALNPKPKTLFLQAPQTPVHSNDLGHWKCIEVHLIFATRFHMKVSSRISLSLKLHKLHWKRCKFDWLHVDLSISTLTHELLAVWVYERRISFR